VHDDELRTIRGRLTEIENQLDRRRPDPVLLPTGGGIYAWLAPGQTVSGSAGAGKGTGTVTLFKSDGVTPRTGAGSTVDVKNAGGGVAGGTVGYLVKLGLMADGTWSLDVAPCAAAV
jgi:hypothetical protein